jgi:serine O-acetyltransferase
MRKLVSALMKSYQREAGLLKIESDDQIDEAVVLDTLEDLRHLVFAGFFTRKRLREDSLEYYAGELLERISYNLEKQVSRALLHKPGGPPDDAAEEAGGIVYAFLERLPDIRRLLSKDVAAAFDGDPAAFSTDEIILSYPGLYAIMVHRLAHELYQLGVPLMPRVMSEHAHTLTGIDIHPGASIGHHFFLDHGTGVVIGETTVIGNHVKIYQGVTLGALSTRGGQQLRSAKRHPTLEDRVTVYSGASILGGATTIGEGVVVGSNAFVIKSVPQRTRVSVKNPELQYKADGEKPTQMEHVQDEYWDYVI